MSRVTKVARTAFSFVGLQFASIIGDSAAQLGVLCREQTQPYVFNATVALPNGLPVPYVSCIHIPSSERRMHEHAEQNQGRKRHNVRMR